MAIALTAQKVFRAPMARRRATIPDVALGLVLLAGAVITLIETRGMSFFGDDWDFVVQRHGLSLNTLLAPHGPHLSLIPVVIYKTILNVFGGGSFIPFRLLDVFDVLFPAAVLAYIARLHWGPWWGLIPAVMFVTLGQAGTSTLWSFQCGYAIAVGMGALALEFTIRGDRRGDRLACCLLIASLASGSQGIGFTVGVALLVALGPRPSRRVWVVAVPVAMYALWYLKYGQSASESDLSLWNTALPYGMQELSSTFGPLLGLSTVAPQTLLLDTTYGLPVAMGAILAVVYCYLWRGWRPPALFWGVVVTLAVLWLATAVSNTPQIPRAPQDSRYLLTNAVLVLIALVVALPKPQANLRTGGIGVAVVVIAIAANNINQFGPSRDLMLNSDIFSRAQVGALLMMRSFVARAFQPTTTVDPSVLVGVTAGNFSHAYDEYGIVADTPAQILTSAELVRATVDAELARGELLLAPLSGTTATRPSAPEILAGKPQRRGSCLALGGGGPMTISAPPGRYELRDVGRSPLTVQVRRFASADWATLGSVGANTAEVAWIHADTLPTLPWVMQMTGSGILCPLVVWPDPGASGASRSSGPRAP